MAGRPVPEVGSERIRGRKKRGKRREKKKKREREREREREGEGEISRQRFRIIAADSSERRRLAFPGTPVRRH